MTSSFIREEDGILTEFILSKTQDVPNEGRAAGDRAQTQSLLLPLLTIWRCGKRRPLKDPQVPEANKTHRVFKSVFIGRTIRLQVAEFELLSG